jgi:hypothetical protein
MKHSQRVLKQLLIDCHQKEKKKKVELMQFVVRSRKIVQSGGKKNKVD